MRKEYTAAQRNPQDVILPRNLQAEQAVLGAILLDNETYLPVREILTPSDFSLDSHRRIFTRMVALSEKRQPIDLITLSEELERAGELEGVGGAAYLSSLSDGLPRTTNVEHYARIVKQKAAARRALELADKAAERIAGDGADPAVTLTALRDGLVQELESLTNDNVAPPEFSEDALALTFSAAHADRLAFTARWGKWHRWTGVRWTEDSTLAVFDDARKVCRAAAEQCPDEKLAKRITAAATVAAVERLARSDRRHAVTVEQWDSDPWVLNTKSGTIDLHTGELKAHNRTDHITKITACGVADAADCPLWLAFLDRVTSGDKDLQGYLQRLAGYALTGSTREHALAFLWGTGANGKSVFVNTISGMMGDYSRTAAISTFIVSGGEQHPTDLAALRGARLVTSIETESGRRWAESKIKALTGGDRIAARFMRQDFFQYVPQFKLVIAGNHKPGLRVVDEAIRRRIHLIPFAIIIPPEERDPDLANKLKDEWPEILRWAVMGCLEWQRRGLDPPEAVVRATEDYLTAEDILGRWVEERCEVGRVLSATAAELFADWKSWCESAGEHAGSAKAFSQRLEARLDLRRVRIGGQSMRGFQGVALRPGRGF